MGPKYLDYKSKSRRKENLGSLNLGREMAGVAAQAGQKLCGCGFGMCGVLTLRGVLCHANRAYWLTMALLSLSFFKKYFIYPFSLYHAIRVVPFPYHPLLPGPVE